MFVLYNTVFLHITSYYIVQDLADAGGCQDEPTLAQIAWQGLQGLSFLHSCHQIHRDLKPANMLINHKVSAVDQQLQHYYLLLFSSSSCAALCFERCGFSADVTTYKYAKYVKYSRSRTQ
jgi:serine/threonine protein kinase